MSNYEIDMDEVKKLKLPAPVAVDRLDALLKLLDEGTTEFQFNGNAEDMLPDCNIELRDIYWEVDEVASNAYVALRALREKLQSISNR